LLFDRQSFPASHILTLYIRIIVLDHITLHMHSHRDRYKNQLLEKRHVSAGGHPASAFDWQIHDGLLNLNNSTVGLLIYAVDRIAACKFYRSFPQLGRDGVTGISSCATSNGAVNSMFDSAAFLKVHLPKKKGHIHNVPLRFLSPVAYFTGRVQLK
jgi:hypothetical protein